jgi:hypothetical protein
MRAPGHVRNPNGSFIHCTLSEVRDAILFQLGVEQPVSAERAGVPSALKAVPRELTEDAHYFKSVRTASTSIRRAQTMSTHLDDQRIEAVRKDPKIQNIIKKHEKTLIPKD